MTKNQGNKVNIYEFADSTNQSPSLTYISNDGETKTPQKVIKNKRKPKASHWGLTEQQKYVNFLVDQRHLFDLDSDKRRVAGIHVKMSKIIKNRTPTQCRSHHQKMLMKYESIDNIILCNSHLLRKKNMQKKISIKEQALNSEQSQQAVVQRLDERIDNFFALDSFLQNPNEDLFFELKEFQSQQNIVDQFYDFY